MVLPVRFGLNVDPNTGGLSIAQRITAIADAAGLELVGIQDHPYNAGCQAGNRQPPRRAPDAQSANWQIPGSRQADPAISRAAH